VNRCHRILRENVLEITCHPSRTETSIVRKFIFKEPLNKSPREVV
jgi:hypothetical protein